MASRLAVVVVEPGDHRHPDPDLRMDAGQGLQVVQDDPVGLAGGGPVAGIVHELEVVEHQRGHGRRRRQQCAQGAKPQVSRAVCTPSAPQALQGLRQEGGLHQRLAAGEGHAAAGLVEEDPVPQQLPDQFGRFQLLRRPAAGRRWGRPPGPRRPMTRPLVPARSSGAAQPAGHAAVLQAQDLGPGRLAFRVVAPEAGQRAALHEHGAAQPGTVLEGEALDVEDRSGAHAGSRCWLSK